MYLKWASGNCKNCSRDLVGDHRSKNLGPVTQARTKYVGFGQGPPAKYVGFGEGPPIQESGACNPGEGKVVGIWSGPRARAKEARAKEARRKEEGAG